MEHEAQVILQELTASSQKLASYDGCLVVLGNDLRQFMFTRSAHRTRLDGAQTLSHKLSSTIIQENDCLNRMINQCVCALKLTP